MEEIDESALMEGVSLLDETAGIGIITPNMSYSTNIYTSTPKSTRAGKKAPKSNFLAQCVHCKRQLKTDRGYGDHLRMHAMKEAHSRSPDTAAIIDACPQVVLNVLEKMKGCVSCGEFGEDFKQYLATIQNLSSTPAWSAFVAALSDKFSKCLGSQNFLLPSALRSVVLRAQNAWFATPQSRDQLISLLTAVQEHKEEVKCQFLGQITLLLADEILIFIFTTLRCASHESQGVISESRCRRSTDNIESVQHKQIVHYISGSVVKGFMRMGFRYKSNALWRNFTKAIKECFIESDLVVAVDDEQKAWTAALSRGGLSYVGKNAHNFFLALADLIMSMELPNGSLGHTAVLTKVFCSQNILFLWDQVMGNNLCENESIILMEAMCKWVIPR